MNYLGQALAGQRPSPRVIATKHDDESTTLVSSEPRECAGCHTMRAVFVCRAGATVCATCDARREASR